MFLPHLFFCPKPCGEEDERFDQEHLTLQDRLELEALYGKGSRVEQIAARLKVHRSTIYNELKRGDTGEMDSNGRIGYSAELAQQQIIKNYRHRRTASAQ